MRPFILKTFKKSSWKRRAFLLLEVLIALTLLALCAFPLFHPHAYILQNEKQFVHAIELERAADLIYAKVVEGFYRKEVSWKEVEESVWKEISPALFSHDPDLFNSLPYRGKYRLNIEEGKGGDPVGVYLLSINMEFMPNFDMKAKPEKYTYYAVVKVKFLKERPSVQS